MIKLNNEFEAQLNMNLTQTPKIIAILLVIGTGYLVQVLSLIIDSSVGLSAGIQSAGDSVPETLGSNPAFSKGR